MKWYGEIGFKEYVETEPGMFIPKVFPYPYMGDIQNLSWKEMQGDKINADLHISNKLSIIADQNLQQNFHKIAYVTFGGAKWTVSDVTVDPDRPRLNLMLGSLYKEEEEEEDVEDES